MRLEQIEEMLLRYRSDNPVERVEGFNALAKFLYRLQPLTVRLADSETGGWPKPEKEED